MTKAAKLALGVLALAFAALALRASLRSSAREGLAEVAVAPQRGNGGGSSEALVGAEDADRREMLRTQAAGQRASLAEESDRRALAADDTPLSTFNIILRVLDLRGAPVSGAKVRIAGPGGTCMSRMSNEDGRLEFRRLSPGSFELIAWRGGYRTLHERVELSGPPRDERRELRLAPLALLEVSVRTPGGEGYFQAIEAKAEGVPRSVLKSMLAVATTAAPRARLPIGLGQRDLDFGIGTWRGAPDTDHRLGYLRVDARTDYFVSLVVQEWVIATQAVKLGQASVSFELDPATVIASGAGVRGRFVDATGAPASGVWVHWDSSRGSTNEQHSGADGRFEFSGLMERSIALRIDRPPHLLAELRLEPGVVVDLGEVVVGSPRNFPVGTARFDPVAWSLDAALELDSDPVAKERELPAGLGVAAVLIEGKISAEDGSTARIARIEADSDAGQVVFEFPLGFKYSARQEVELLPGRYTAGHSWPGTSVFACARLVPFEIAAGETTEVAIRLEPSGALVLEPAGRASIGTRFGLRDEATGLVNRTGGIARDEATTLILPRGAWILELELLDGSRSTHTVVVGEAPVHVPLPH